MCHQYSTALCFDLAYIFISHSGRGWLSASELSQLLVTLSHIDCVLLLCMLAEEWKMDIIKIFQGFPIARPRAQEYYDITKLAKCQAWNCKPASPLLALKLTSTTWQDTACGLSWLWDRYLEPPQLRQKLPWLLQLSHNCGTPPPDWLLDWDAADQDPLPLQSQRHPSS